MWRYWGGGAAEGAGGLGGRGRCWLVDVERIWVRIVNVDLVGGGFEEGEEGKDWEDEGGLAL